jgi:fructose-1,6-bisphosphatase/inositol monophosphatase family enzyme
MNSDEKDTDQPAEISHEEKTGIKSLMAACLRAAYANHESLGVQGAQEVRQNQSGEMSLLVDIRCEEAVIGVLREAGLPVRIVSEEHGTFDLCDNPRFMVVLDGLDGSGVYKKRGGQRYGTMCAIFAGIDPHYGDYIAGGIMEHPTDKLYLYARGEGATVRDLATGVIFPPLHTRREKKLWEDVFIYVDEYFAINRETFSDKLKGYWTIYLGSSAAAFSYLACGVAGAVGECTRRPRKDNLELMVAYGLIREAGGVMWTLEGNDIGGQRFSTFGKEGHIPILAAANPALAGDLLEHIKNQSQA